MTTITEIENSHIEHRLEGLEENFIFKPAKYSSYGEARKNMKVLMNNTGYTGLSNIEKEIVCRWYLVVDPEILNSSEQERILKFHNSHIKTKFANCKNSSNISSYFTMSDQILYDGSIHSEILNINIIAKSESTFSVRIYDNINFQVIAEKTNITNSDFQIIELTDILYQPENKTLLEVQVKKESGTQEIITESFEMNFL